MRGSDGRRVRSTTCASFPESSYSDARSHQNERPKTWIPSRPTELGHAGVISRRTDLLEPPLSPAGIFGEETRERHELFAAQFGIDVADPRVAKNLSNSMHPKED